MPLSRCFGCGRSVVQQQRTPFLRNLQHQPVEQLAAVHAQCQSGIVVVNVVGRSRVYARKPYRNAVGNRFGPAECDHDARVVRRTVHLVSEPDTVALRVDDAGERVIVLIIIGTVFLEVRNCALDVGYFEFARGEVPGGDHRCAIEFDDVEVEEILTPRVDVVAVEDDISLEELAQTFAESGYSRLPVYHDTVDNIIGVVHEKDFYIARLKKTVTMEDLIAPTLYTTGSTQISQLLRTLREQHHHMAVVVDEYGGTEGIITLEDILEELVGEIWDEHDEATEDFRQQSDGSWLVSGSASVDDLYETLDLPEDEDIDSNTVNGLVQEKTHHLPKVGDHFQLNDYEGVVTRTARRRVTEVRFTHTAPAPQDDEKDKDKRFSRLAQRTEGR